MARVYVNCCSECGFPVPVRTVKTRGDGGVMGYVTLVKEHERVIDGHVTRCAGTGTSPVPRVKKK